MRMLAILDFFSFRQVAAAREGDNARGMADAAGPDRTPANVVGDNPRPKMCKLLIFQQLTPYPASSSDLTAPPLTRPEPAMAPARLPVAATPPRAGSQTLWKWPAPGR